jgi:hypothetical protein
MVKQTHRSASLVATGVLLIVMAASFSCMAQRLAVFVQSAAAVPTADLQLIKNYAAQRCAIISGADVCSQGELMRAQRVTDTYVGNSITVNGMRTLASNLGVSHVVILRIVRWDKTISFRPERSLLLLSVTSFLNTSLKILASPLGLLLGIDKEATVGLFATVFSAQGDIRFTTGVTYEDRPLFSLLTATPVEAAKGAIDDALYQIAVAL